MERRLAVILAGDVVGYSRLMAEDEAGTYDRLRAGVSGCRRRARAALSTAAPWLPKRSCALASDIRLSGSFGFSSTARSAARIPPAWSPPWERPQLST